jgi:IS30 family transposase
MGKYTHLSVSDRHRFSVFLEMGLSMCEIAKRLSKHRSTLYRELERNKAQLKVEERAQEVFFQQYKNDCRIWS